MHLTFLKPHQVSHYWHTIAPLFAKVITKAVHGEYTFQNLKDMAEAGHYTIGIATDPEAVPIMAIAFETVHYPSGIKAINVLAMGGRDLHQFMTQFLPPFAQWCHHNGADWIECMVSRGMERIHHRYGFQTIYRNLRLPLNPTTKEKP